MSSKKEQILATALELFVNQGLGATATSQIAKAAGVATGTLFHHFPSKDELVRQLYLVVKRQMAAAMVPPGDDLPVPAQMAHYWDRALDWAVDNPLALRFMAQIYAVPGTGESLRNQAMEKVLPVVPELLHQGQAQGLLRPLEPTLAMASLQAQFLATALWLIQRPEQSRDPALRRQSLDILWSGLSNH